MSTVHVFQDIMNWGHYINVTNAACYLHYAVMKKSQLAASPLQPH